MSRAARRPASPAHCLENLDLFGDPAAPALLPATPDPVDQPEPLAESSFLFRIGPNDQRDLFKDSPADLAAGAIRAALKAQDLDQIRVELAQLRRYRTHELFVQDVERCIALIERDDVRWNDVATAVAWIESELGPAARRCLHRQADALIRPALLALIERAGPPPYCATPREGHPSYLWQALDEPIRAAAALETDPDWRMQASSLCWHADLSELSGDTRQLHADVAELCIAHPAEAEQWLATSRYWTARWSAWCDLESELPTHAFPAWCRLTRAVEFPVPDPDDQRIGAALLRLAQGLCSNAGADLGLRKELRALCPELLAEFLSHRSGG